MALTYRTTRLDRTMKAARSTSLAFRLEVGHFYQPNSDNFWIGLDLILYAFCLIFFFPFFLHIFVVTYPKSFIWLPRTIHNNKISNIFFDITSYITYLQYCANTIGKIIIKYRENLFKAVLVSILHLVCRFLLRFSLAQSTLEKF